MAMALGFFELNAANFESGNASDGTVLTADGSGGAAWVEAAGGGAGAAFAFDGATLTPGAYNADVNWRNVDVELTLGGAAITTGTIWFMVAASKTGTFIAEDGFAPVEVVARMSSGSLSDTAMRAFADAYNATSLIAITPSGGHAIATVVLENVTNTPGVGGYIVVFLPSGGIVRSDLIEIGAEPPPP